jgi:hypothetical protein
MVKLEKDIERSLRLMVEKHGGMCLKWVCPGWSGVPDRIVLLPGGRIIFVETKRPKGGELSPMQKWWGRKLRDFGFKYWSIWNPSDLNDFADCELADEVRT